MEKKKHNYQQLKRTFKNTIHQPLVKVKIPTFTEHIHPDIGEIIYLDKITNKQIPQKISLL